MNLIRDLRLDALQGAEPATNPADRQGFGAAAGAWRRPLIGVGVGVLVLFGLFWEAAAHTVRIWYDSATFNHGFVILPIVAYLIWRRLPALHDTAPQPFYPGLVAMAVVAFGWLLGNVAGVMVVQQFALLAMVELLFLTALGWRAVRILAFPLFYLIFAIPFGEFLISPLQDVTAVFAVEMLRTIGIPVYHDGIFISIPNGNFEVAEACSGVRFLIATVALGSLFANLNYYTAWRRALFMALSFAVPIVANGFRAFGIIYVAHLTDDQTAIAADHVTYGWIFFAIVTVILLLLGTTFRERTPPKHTTTHALPTAGATRRSAVVAGLCAVAIAAGAPAYAAFLDGAAVAGRSLTLVAPASGGGWTRVAAPADSWRPDFPGADSELLATYVKGADSVHLYIAYYDRQRQGFEVASNQNRIADGKTWSRAQTGSVVARVDGKPVKVETTRMLGIGGTRVAWHWYWIDGVYSSDRYYAKALEAKAKLLGRPGSGALIAIASDYTDSVDEAVKVLHDFLRHVGPIGPALARLAAR